MFEKFVEKCRKINPEIYQRNKNKVNVPINNEYVQKIFNIFPEEDTFYLYNLIRKVCWLNNFKSITELNNLLINIINDFDNEDNNFTFKSYISKKGLII